MNSLYGHITIDGADAYGSYGLVILKGSMTDWLLFPEMKEPYSHDWADQHGLEVDLDNVFVKEKNVSLKVLFVADSELGFWNNYKALSETLAAPGLRTIFYRELGREFEAYFVKSSAPEAFTRLKTNQICVGMTLFFTIPRAAKPIPTGGGTGTKYPKFSGHLTIDGKDALSEYGFLTQKGSMSDWLLFPGIKEPFSHDWRNEDGTDVDLENIFLKEKEVTLKVWLAASSFTEFWQKYDRAEAMLTAPGLRTIYYRELEKEFEVYYLKSSNVTAPTRLRNTDKIFIGMELSFMIPDPSKFVEKLIPPTSITINAPSVIKGSGQFSYAVLPENASKGVKITIVPGTGAASVSGNTINAIRYGTVTLRIESIVDRNVYAEAQILVYAGNLIEFADGVMPSSGNFIIAYK